MMKEFGLTISERYNWFSGALNSIPFWHFYFLFIGFVILAWYLFVNVKDYS